MSFGLILSSVAFGISLVITGLKLVDWLLHSDPRALVRMGRYAAFGAAVTSVPALVILLALQQWSGAMALGAGLLAVAAALNWRAFLPRRRFTPLWSEIHPTDDLRGDFGQPPPDPELARRAAIVLEDYLRHAGHPDIGARIDGGRDRRVRHAGTGADGEAEAAAPGEGMGAEEALAVLGLAPGATPAAVRAAHRRLVQLVHPDRGGSNYLAAKINEAKDVLLAEAARRPRAPRARKAAGRPSATDA